MDISVTAVAAWLDTDAVGKSDAFGCLDIFCDFCTRNHDITFLLGNGICFHALENRTADSPDRTGTLRRSCDIAVKSSVCKSGLGGSIDGIVKLLAAGGIVHDDQYGISLFDREHLVQAALHNVNQLAFEKLNGSRHKRKIEYLRNHIGTFLQAGKRQHERRSAGWCRK